MLSVCQFLSIWLYLFRVSFGVFLSSCRTRSVNHRFDGRVGKMTDDSSQSSPDPVDDKMFRQRMSVTTAWKIVVELIELNRKQWIFLKESTTVEQLFRVALQVTHSFWPIFTAKVKTMQFVHIYFILANGPPLFHLISLPSSPFFLLLLQRHRNWSR